jgi:diaminopimelate decarboxylase
MSTQAVSRLWWERDDLHYHNSQLYFAGQNLSALAHSAGTPVYFYSAARLEANLNRLKRALTKHGVKHQVFYALKANRFLPLVTYLKLTGLCGVDVCSPNELRLARQVGFREEEITYTGTSVSNEDLEWLRRHSQVWVNCDSLSSIRRLGERCPGRPIGLRINPQLGLGYNPALEYAGDKATKFGLYPDRYPEALALAQSYDLRVKTLHFHIGSGYLSHQLDTLDKILERTVWFLEQCPTIDTLDIGGGLGVPLLEGQQPLDLDRWATIIASYAQAHHLKIQLEPGDYLVKDAGVLILEVNSVEEKGGTTFVGVNGGFNLQNLSVYYHTPFIIVPLQIDPAAPRKRVTIAGNINEALDLLAEDVVLPALREGDLLALLNVGGYGSASSSNHCMRGQFAEYLLLGE